MYNPDRQLFNANVAGFQYKEGPFVLHKLKPGKRLEMRIQPDNPYDPNAIALYYKDTHIGYVPRNNTWPIFQMLYYGHTDAFEAVVTAVRPDEHPANQVHFAVYLTDKRAIEHEPLVVEKLAVVIEPND